MKKILASFLITFFSFQVSSAQDSAVVRPRALGISFVLTDFGTAQRIRNGSMERVLREKTWSKFGEMSPGISVTYFQGLRSHIDFAGTLLASYVSYPIPNKAQVSTDNLLLEADASLNFKLVSERYWVSPYISAGIGASKFKNYYGAIVPLGIGLKVNFFDEAALFINTQYRVGLTKETTSSHFIYSLGIAGVIGNE